MGREKPKLQIVLYRVFVVSCILASALALLMIWGLEPPPVLIRLLGTCVVVTLATALTMSATRLVGGRPPEDDNG